MSLYDDEIDLRPYIRVLIRYKWLIITMAVVAALAGMLFSLRQPETYEAEASILVTRERTKLSLAEQFPTVTDPIDANSRMNAMISIAKSDSLALSVLQELKDSLPSDINNLNAFNHQVKVSSNGDLILVTASANSPSLASKIANAWAEETVRVINQAHGGAQPIAEIQNLRQNAQKKYEAAQATLESFIQESRIDVLSTQIKEAETLFDNLSGDRTWLINYYEQRKQDMQNIIIQAEALRNQIEVGNHSVAGDLGDALAVLNARATALGITHLADPTNPDGMINSSNLTFDLQITDPEVLHGETTSYVVELTNLIKQANEEKAATETALESLTQSVINREDNQVIDEIASTIRFLKAQLERQEASERELTNERDVTWQAYEAMLQKETELINAPQISNEVTLAVPAIQPSEPSPRGIVRNTIIAGIIGLIAGIFGVLLSEWWRSIGITQTHPTSGSQKVKENHG